MVVGPSVYRTHIRQSSSPGPYQSPLVHHRYTPELRTTPTDTRAQCVIFAHSGPICLGYSPIQRYETTLTGQPIPSHNPFPSVNNPGESDAVPDGR